jgi:hypothetical protein
MALSAEGQESILLRVVGIEHLAISDFCEVKHREKRWQDYLPVKLDFTQIFRLTVPDLEEPSIDEDRCNKLKEDRLIQQLR